jgi:hypothetical protein
VCIEAIFMYFKLQQMITHERFAFEMNARNDQDANTI